VSGCPSWCPGEVTRRHEAEPEWGRCCAGLANRRRVPCFVPTTRATLVPTLRRARTQQLVGPQLCQWRDVQGEALRAGRTPHWRCCALGPEPRVRGARLHAACQPFVRWASALPHARGGAPLRAPVVIALVRSLLRADLASPNTNPPPGGLRRRQGPQLWRHVRRHLGAVVALAGRADAAVAGAPEAGLPTVPGVRHAFALSLCVLGGEGGVLVQLSCEAPIF
jgi:hypothetical protein